MTEAGSLLDRRIAQFAERNMVLWLALGGLGYARKLDDLLERYGQVDPAREPVAGDDEVLLALLGLVALKQQLEGVLDDAAVELESAATREPPPRVGLLR